MVTPAKEPVPNEDRIVELYQRLGEGWRSRSFGWGVRRP